MAAITVLVTDPDFAIVGNPLTTWTRLECTRRFNGPGDGMLTMPATPDVMAQLQPGNRITIIRDGAEWMAGPIEVPQNYTWGISGEGEPGVGQVTATFTDDLALIAGYLTWPAPASAWAAQPNTAARQITSTNAEVIIRTLVDENCGPGALTARRVPHLALDTLAGVGTTTSVNTRLEALLDACRRVAIDGGGLGFRTRRSGGQILFGVYAPADLTATARFSAGLGNLRALTYRATAPTVTHALVSGSETATPRIYVEAADTAAASTWWRVEQHVAAGADNDTAGELTQEGTAALAEGAAPVELSTVTVDTDDLAAGVHFGLGDLVTVELPTGLEVTDVVRAITLHAEPDAGEQVTTLIGSPDATSDPRMVRIVRELGRRLGRLEAR